MRRNFWFWLYFTIAIIAAVYFATRVSTTIMGRAKTSIVRNISISADGNNRDLSAVAAAAAIPPQTRSYSVDLDVMATRINDVPGVRNAAVRRRANGNLAVHAELYQAVAMWTDGKYFFPISADGTIVNTPSETRNEGYVVFRGAVPNNISDITNAAHTMIGDVDYLEWIDGRRWNLITSSGITVMLPEDDGVAAIGALIMLNKNHQILSRDIDLIDMRDSARILVK